MPPLRERVDDIPLLVDFFLDKHAGRLNRPRPGVSDTAITALQTREWPGNVRELENCVERAILLAAGDTLEPDDFGLAAGPDAAPVEGGIKSVARAAAAEAERRMIRAALDVTDGNITHAAERLGLSRRGLQLKMKELGLRSE
jgi:DNA-binding NtrC family response regulator